jgi:bifunctional DNA-binding transcriptional regulator/antitoxin component of YhaV-PrlF toxin-antitoxin module
VSLVEEAQLFAVAAPPQNLRVVRVTSPFGASSAQQHRSFHDLAARALTTLEGIVGSMTRMIRVSSLVLGFLIFVVAQQTGDTRATASRTQWQTASQGPRKLFPNDDGTTFLNVDGSVVLSASEPRLQKEIRRISRGFDQFREPEGSAPISLRFEEFSEGFAVVGWALCPNCRNPFWLNGFIDETGRLAIPPRSYGTNYGTFHEGLAKYTDGGWGFIDRSGRIVIPAKFSIVGEFSEGLAFVSPSGKERYGYINKLGKLVIPTRFRVATDFHEGLALVILMKLRYAFIDRTGKVVLQSRNWRGVDRFSEGLALVRVSVKNNKLYRGSEELKYGFIDRTGGFVIPPQFDRVETFSEGRALFGEFVKNGSRLRDRAFLPTNRAGFIDATGKVVIKAEYLDAKRFSEGLAAVAVMSSEKKKVWGYIDREGRILIPPQFTNPGPFRGGLAAVNCDDYARNCKAYVDRQGKVVWQAGFTDARK